MPEGVEIRAEDLEVLTPILKGMNATQAQGQELIDLQVAMNTRAFEAQTQAWADTQAAWQKAAETDKEYGNASYDDTVEVARNAVHELGGEALQVALTETGMGNHPEFIRAFWRLGKAMGEDTIDFGEGKSEGVPKTIAQRMFPKHKEGPRS